MAKTKKTPEPECIELVGPAGRLSVSPEMVSIYESRGYRVWEPDPAPKPANAAIKDE